MKRLLFAILIFSCYWSSAQNIRTISYNIRYNNPGDGINAWPNRSHDVAALLKFHRADVFCLQEALIGQIEDLQTQLPEMKWVGVGRDDGKNAGEFCPIFYNSEKYVALNKGWFWLNETCDKPGLGWDAACNRTCVWIILKENKSGKEILVVNTHFDHMGIKARDESAKLILRKIKELNKKNIPIILTGDFNLTPETSPIAIITETLHDSKAISKEKPYGPDGTFNGFKFDSPLTDRIDYIFVNDLVDVLQYAVLSDSKNMRYPSDHLPVFVNLELKKGK